MRWRTSKFAPRFRRWRWAMAMLACGIVPGMQPSRAFSADTSPVGVWRTFDDKTGRENGLVRIWAQNGVLYGNIAGVVDPADAKKSCDKCGDDRKGKPLIGLNILRGLHQDGNQWDGGEILDPETGRTYRCSMRVKDGGRQLVVRGYLGISLLGRSETWRRAQ